jgi:amino acid adenylation domain-containing protein
MSDFEERIASLTPEKRALLELRLLQRPEAAPAPPAAPQRSFRTKAPLSFAQQRLWFLDQMDPGRATYNVLQAYRLRGPFRSEDLHASVRALVERHEILRTRFPSSDGVPFQEIAPGAAPGIAEVDLTGLPAGEREAAAISRAREEGSRPFDLARGPLLRVTLWKLSAEDHLLLIAMHHIVSDGWSAAILQEELSELCAAHREGRAPRLPELSLQYADYAAHQRERLSGERLEAELDYWRRELSGALPVLELPTDRPRPAVRDLQGGSHAMRLTPELTRALKALARDEGATLFMVLLAALDVLLWRYTGQEDILVGTPIAGRTRLETEPLLGFFANTLVLRCDLSGEPSFRELISRVKRKALSAYAHQETPFEKIVEELHPDRSLSHSPFFQVMFVLQNAPSLRLRLPDLAIEPVELETGSSQFDLTWEVVEAGDALEGWLEYSVDIFDATTIARMAGHIEMALESVVADPDRPISALPILPQGERRCLLSEWNDTKAEYPREACIQELFERQADRAPQAVAAISGGRSLSYGQLDSLADSLARRLRAQGVAAEVSVGIFLERSLEMLIAVLGVLKAGGAYVPLDPDWPAERLAFVLEDSGAAVLLSQERLATRLPPGTPSVLWLDGIPLTETEARERLRAGVGPENLAYVIYTSGSSGRPKGVEVPHGALVNHAVAFARIVDLSPSDRMLQFHSLAFDASAEDLFPAWAVGAAVVLRPDPIESLPEFERFLAREGVTVVNLPTAFWREWVEARTAWREPLPAGVRLVMVGGESASAERYRTWRERAGGSTRWINSYGPTEATITSLVHEPPAPGVGGVSVPIGRPLSNARAYVLDPFGQPTPVGVPGELHLAGRCLARGYRNRPDLTADRFLPDPFLGEGGERSYRTGDRARWLPDGTLEFLGRLDDQVKIRGFRIEPGEVEAVLRAHPGLAEAVVIPRVDARGALGLVAYFVDAPGASSDEAGLRGFLTGKLPEYMIPSHFVRLPEIPRTSSDKLDRRALPDPGRPRSDPAEASSAPRTVREERLAALWASLLGLERVGIHDDFFELGGHSLLVLQLASRLREQERVELSVRDLFEARTVARLAERIDAIHWAAEAPPMEAGRETGVL